MPTTIDAWRSAVSGGACETSSRAIVASSMRSSSPTSAPAATCAGISSSPRGVSIGSSSSGRGSGTLSAASGFLTNALTDAFTSCSFAIAASSPVGGGFGFGGSFDGRSLKPRSYAISRKRARTSSSAAASASSMSRLTTAALSSFWPSPRSFACFMRTFASHFIFATIDSSASFFANSASTAARASFSAISSAFSKAWRRAANSASLRLCSPR